jgi:hypothetical protein
MPWPERIVIDSEILAGKPAIRGTRLAVELLQRRIPLKRCGVILFRVFPAIPENLDAPVQATLRGEHAWIGRVSIVYKGRHRDDLDGRNAVLKPGHPRRRSDWPLSGT